MCPGVGRDSTMGIPTGRSFSPYPFRKLCPDRRPRPTRAPGPGPGPERIRPPVNGGRGHRPGAAEPGPRLHAARRTPSTRPVNGGPGAPPRCGITRAVPPASGDITTHPDAAADRGSRRPAPKWRAPARAVRPVLRENTTHPLNGDHGGPPRGGASCSTGGRPGGASCSAGGRPRTAGQCPQVRAGLHAPGLAPASPRERRGPAVAPGAVGALAGPLTAPGPGPRSRPPRPRRGNA